MLKSTGAPLSVECLVAMVGVNPKPHVKVFNVAEHALALSQPSRVVVWRSNRILKKCVQCVA
jgi:hypothetical protein